MPAFVYRRPIPRRKRRLYPVKALPTTTIYLNVGASLEWLRAERRDCPVPVHAIGGMAQDNAPPNATSGAIRADSVAPLARAYVGYTTTLNGSVPLAWLAVTQSDTAPPFASLETIVALTINASVPIAWYATARTDGRSPVYNTTTTVYYPVQGDGSFPLFWGRSTRQDSAAPIASLAGIARDGIVPNSAAGGLVRGFGAAYSWTGVTIWTSPVPISPAAADRLDWPMPVQTIGGMRQNSGVSVASVQGVLQDAVAALIASEGITGAASVPVASMTGQTAAMATVLATTGGISFAASPAIGTTGGIGRNVPAPLASAQGAALGGSVPLGVAGSVQLDGVAPNTWRANLLCDFVVPLSAQRILQMDALDTGVPIEWRATSRRDCLGKIEFRAAIVIDYVENHYYSEFPFSTPAQRVVVGPGGVRIAIDAGASRAAGLPWTGRFTIGG